MHPPAHLVMSTCCWDCLFECVYACNSIQLAVHNKFSFRSFTFGSKHVPWQKPHIWDILSYVKLCTCWAIYIVIFKQYQQHLWHQGVRTNKKWSCKSNTVFILPTRLGAQAFIRARRLQVYICSFNTNMDKIQTCKQPIILYIIHPSQNSSSKWSHIMLPLNTGKKKNYTLKHVYYIYII